MSSVPYIAKHRPKYRLSEIVKSNDDRVILGESRNFTQVEKLLAKYGSCSVHREHDGSIATELIPHKNITDLKVTQTTYYAYCSLIPELNTYENRCKLYNSNYALVFPSQTNDIPFVVVKGVPMSLEEFNKFKQKEKRLKKIKRKRCCE